MFPFLPVKLWGWWRTGGQGDRPHRGIHGGHHPQPVGRGGAPGRTCPPCVPGGPGARGPNRVRAERGQCPLRTQQTGAQGPAPADACGSHGGHGPAWWMGGLPATSSGPSGCDWPAADAVRVLRAPAATTALGTAPDEAGVRAGLGPSPAPASRPSWSLLGVRSPRAWLGQVVPCAPPALGLSPAQGQGLRTARPGAAPGSAVGHL